MYIKIIEKLTKPNEEEPDPRLHDLEAQKANRSPGAALMVAIDSEPEPVPSMSSNGQAGNAFQASLTAPKLQCAYPQGISEFQSKMVPGHAGNFCSGAQRAIGNSFRKRRLLNRRNLVRQTLAVLPFSFLLPRARPLRQRLIRWVCNRPRPKPKPSENGTISRAGFTRHVIFQGRSSPKARWVWSTKRRHGEAKSAHWRWR